jgi:hypothetical protein
VEARRNDALPAVKLLSTDCLPGAHRVDVQTTLGACPQTGDHLHLGMWDQDAATIGLELVHTQGGRRRGDATGGAKSDERGHEGTLRSRARSRKLVAELSVSSNLLRRRLATFRG